MLTLILCNLIVRFSLKMFESPIGQLLFLTLNSIDLDWFKVKGVPLGQRIHRKQSHIACSNFKATSHSNKNMKDLWIMRIKTNKNKWKFKNSFLP